MDIPVSTDVTTLEEFLMRLRMLIEDTEKSYQKFLKKTKNTTESKKLTLTFDNFNSSYNLIFNICFEIYKHFVQTRETVYKQGEIEFNIRPKIEALGNRKLLSTLTKLSSDGVIIVSALMKKQYDYFFGILLPCLEVSVLDDTPKDFMNDLKKAADIANQNLEQLETNLTFLRESEQSYANFNIIYAEFIDKLKSQINDKS